jgi:hypothetical protein
MIKLSLVTASAVVSTIVVAVALYILVPTHSLTTATLISGAFLSMAVGNLIYVPRAIGTETRDPTRIAAIGPEGVFALSLLLWITANFIISLYGYQRISYAMSVLTLGGFVVGRLTLRTTLDTIGAISVQTDFHSRHSTWRESLLTASREIKDAEIGRKMSILANDALYLSRARPPADDVLSLNFHEAIEGIKSAAAAGDKDECKTQLEVMKRLFQENEDEVRSKNTKA